MSREEVEAYKADMEPAGYRIETALDCMRALDYAESREDIDATRIGFVGFSQGAILGTAFCGLR